MPTIRFGHLMHMSAWFITIGVSLIVLVPIGRWIGHAVVRLRRPTWVRLIAKEHGVDLQWLDEHTQDWA